MSRTRQWNKGRLSSLATVVFIAIGLVLIGRYGPSVGYGFLLVVFLLLIAGRVVMEEITRQNRQRFRAEVQQSLAGETMCGFLKRNPDRLRELREQPTEAHAALLEALDADDARCVKHLLESADTE